MQLPVLRAMRSRRSVRTYTSDPVGDDVLRDVVDVARHAPSSLNGQPCVFVILRQAASRQALAHIKKRYCPTDKAAYPCDFLAHAPAVVVVCVEDQRAHGRGLETATLATANLMLAAHSHGLSSVYLTAQRPGQPALQEEVRALLGLPTDVSPMTIVPLGYPAHEPPARSLRNLEEVIRYERY